MQTDDGRLSALSRDDSGGGEVGLEAGEVGSARDAQAAAERRAAQAVEELRALQAGLGYRVLVSYRALARRLAPEGSRRGDGYDVVMGAARRSAGRVRRRVAGPAEGDGPAPSVPSPPEDDTQPPPVAVDAPSAIAVAVPEPAEPAEPAETGETAPTGPPGADTWFRDHYDFAAGRVIEFLAVDGIGIEGKQVADIGAGDGILDLGLVHKGRPARLVGFDLNATHADLLLESARREGVCDVLPDALEFEVSKPTGIPAADGSFDVVITWSAFEHIADPLGVLVEARRVVKEDGVLFVQVWPFYHSQFGSHLRDWFPDGWEHLEHAPEELEAMIRASDLHTQQWADVMLHEFSELNKTTVDDLGRALVEAGFGVRRLNLLTREVPLPSEPALRLPLSALGIEGVELTAVPLPR